MTATLLLLRQLFVSFALIGVAAYGGGLVVIPLIQHELVSQRGWINFAEMAQIVAIAQMTPGPIAVNAATFAGYYVSGLVGAAVATFAVVLPSILLLSVLSSLLERTKSNVHVQRIRRSLQNGVLALILFAIWSYGRGVIGGVTDFLVAVAAFAAMVAFAGKVHPVLIIVACGLAGIVLF